MQNVADEVLEEETLAYNPPKKEAGKLTAEGVIFVDVFLLTFLFIKVVKSFSKKSSKSPFTCSSVESINFAKE